ncbi:MAG: Eco57I restriction-modification methylase domain-containing protein, partial [Planctomycetaceae bacterium]|nr:Eco57I restriction-modification methylase domain-containing protein [Planctomycetaceae bacterium]
QITQLRLFLSLIQEIKPDRRQENYGIEPLPNLETKFVCADTLIGLKQEKQKTFESPIVKETLKGLLDIRGQHVTASTMQEKKFLQGLDESRRKMLVMAMEDTGEWKRETVELIKNWNPYNQSKTAAFFDPQCMFGIPNGFDIVIGNPPYVKQGYFTEKQKEKYYSAFGFYGDLYAYFIFAAFNLLVEKGTLCFIANDSFLGFRNTKNIRKLFFDNDLRQIMSCDMVFDEADIYPAIFLLKKQKSKTQQYETGTYSKTADVFIKAGAVDYALSQNLVHQRIVINSPIAAIYTKLLSFGKMKDICSILDTGIHTGNCRSKLLFREHEKSNLNKILQGKQISRYAFDWNSPQAKFKYCDIHYEPANEYGIGRGGKPSKAKEYWHFCGDESNHRVDEKILLRQTEDDLVACYINREKDGLFYTDNTLFTVLPGKDYHIFFVLGLLNSRLLNVLYHFLSQEEGKSLAQVKTQVVGFLPVPLVGESQQRPIILLVDEILCAKRVDSYADTSSLEREIDALVYALYGLTAAEVAVVEGNTSGDLT